MGKKAGSFPPIRPAPAASRASRVRAARQPPWQPASAARNPAGGSGKDARTNGSKPAISAEQTIASEPQKAADKPAAPTEAPIVFLCPNGHKLNAPRHMQGHAGKCPHSGAKSPHSLGQRSGLPARSTGATSRPARFKTLSAPRPQRHAAPADGVYDHLTEVTAPAAAPATAGGTQRPGPGSASAGPVGYPTLVGTGTRRHRGSASQRRRNSRARMVRQETLAAHARTIRGPIGGRHSDHDDRAVGDGVASGGARRGRASGRAV